MATIPDEEIRELRRLVEELTLQLHNYAFECAPGWWPRVEKAYNELKQAKEYGMKLPATGLGNR